MFNEKMCFPPQGSIGDCFVMAGAANWFSDRCNHLVFPVLNKANQAEIAHCLFRDNPKITVFPYNDPACSDLNIIINKERLMMITATVAFAVTMEDGTRAPILWDEQNYTLMDIPFSVRYNHFRLPNVEKEAKELFNRVVKNPSYILCSQQMRNKGSVAKLKIPDTGDQIIELTEELSSNIILYSELVKHAKEIHCVPSSVFCFIDSITHTTKAKLFYHDIRKHTLMRINNQWNNHRWNIISYDYKL